MPDIYFSKIIKKMSLIGKLNFLVSKKNQLDGFLEFGYEINKNPLHSSREVHKPTWCNGACSTMKFLNQIIENNKKNTSAEEKTFCFLIIQCLKNKDVFVKLFELYFW